MNHPLFRIRPVTRGIWLHYGAPEFATINHHMAVRQMHDYVETAHIKPRKPTYTQMRKRRHQR